MCKILNRQELKPHKVRYYLERRDAEFEAKMAEALRLSRGCPPERAGCRHGTRTAPGGGRRFLR